MGGANFQTSEGTFVGRLTAEGTLDISGFSVGSVPRSLSLHVDGIGTNFPAYYSVGDRAFYGVGMGTSTDNRTDFDFQQPYGSATLTLWPTRRLLMLRWWRERG